MSAHAVRMRARSRSIRRTRSGNVIGRRCLALAAGSGGEDFHVPANRLLFIRSFSSCRPLIAAAGDPPTILSRASRRSLVDSSVALAPAHPDPPMRTRSLTDACCFSASERLPERANSEEERYGGDFFSPPGSLASRPSVVVPHPLSECRILVIH